MEISKCILKIKNIVTDILAHDLLKLEIVSLQQYNKQKKLVSIINLLNDYHTYYKRHLPPKNKKKAAPSTALFCFIKNQSSNFSLITVPSELMKAFRSRSPRSISMIYLRPEGYS